VTSATNVVFRLEELARAAPSRPAIVEPAGARITFAELDARTAAVAGALLEHGFTPGDRLLLLMPMSIALYVSLLGILRAGCTAVLVDPSARGVDEKLRRLQLRGFFGSARAHLLRLRHRALRGLPLYVAPRTAPLPAISLDSLRGAPASATPVDETIPALLTFTTGSTGTPKALARSHHFLESQRRILSEHMGLGPEDVDLPTLPVFLLNSLAAGATCVLPDADLRRVSAVRPERVIRQIRDWRCTTTSGSPAFLGPIARALRETGESLPELRRVFTGGAPVPPSVLDDLSAVAPNARIEVLYGSSEAEPIASIDAREVRVETASLEAQGRGRCVGRPIHGTEVRICAVGGTRRLEPGNVGEILVAGAHVSRAYFDDPAADAASKVHHGPQVWHRTGDTGYLDHSGRLWLAGRVGDEAGGRHPLLVEAAAEAYPWVRRAAMVEPDGSVVLACEVRDPPEGWRDRLRVKLDVDDVVEVRRIPVDPRHNAKVDRKSVRAMLARARWRAARPTHPLRGRP
jgi:acyl-CoA synthetase (AMP-forming)/AMP-acid ligase II